MSMGYMQPPGYFEPKQPPPPRGAPRSPDAPPPVVIREVPDGFPGTQVIVGDMVAKVLSAYQDERVNILAREVTMGCPRHDYRCEAETILRWFQERFRYTRLPWHPKGFQRVQTASYTLFDSPVKTGECASLSVAMAAMLMSMGFEVQFETAGQDPADPLDFEHVYLSVNVPEVGWLAADPSYEGPLGWKHPNARVTMLWPIA